ncbi:hypothetical protein KGM_213628A, partial [Danaus plexippus plexippus]
MCPLSFPDFVTQE